MLSRTLMFVTTLGFTALLVYAGVAPEGKVGPIVVVCSALAIAANALFLAFGKPRTHNDQSSPLDA